MMFFNIGIGPYLLSAILFGSMSLNLAQESQKKHCWADSVCIWYAHGSFYQAQSSLDGYTYEGISKAKNDIITYSQKTKWKYQAKDTTISATGYKDTLLMKSKDGLSKFDLSKEQLSVINNSHSGGSGHWILISGENIPYGIVEQQDNSYGLVDQKWLLEGTSDSIPNACLQEFSLATKVTGCKSSIFQKLNYGFLYSSELYLVSKDKKWVLVFDSNWLKEGAKTEVKKMRKFPDFFNCEPSTVGLPIPDKPKAPPSQPPAQKPRPPVRPAPKSSGFPFLLGLFPPRSRQYSAAKLFFSWILHILGLILMGSAIYNVPKLLKEIERQPAQTRASSSQSGTGKRGTGKNLKLMSTTVRSSIIRQKQGKRQSTLGTSTSVQSSALSKSIISQKSSRITKKSRTSPETLRKKKSKKSGKAKFRPKSPATRSKSRTSQVSSISKQTKQNSKK